VRWGVARQIVWAWVMTIPAAFAIGAGVYTPSASPARDNTTKSSSVVNLLFLSLKGFELRDLGGRLFVL
jgi:hypothetical protein